MCKYLQQVALLFMLDFTVWKEGVLRYKNRPAFCFRFLILYKASISYLEYVSDHKFSGSKYFVIRLVGRTLCSPRTKTSIKPMSKTNVGANLMFALRTTTRIKPMFENELGMLYK